MTRLNKDELNVVAYVSVSFVGYFLQQGNASFERNIVSKKSKKKMQCEG